MPVRDAGLQFANTIAVEGTIHAEGKDRVCVEGHIMATQMGACARCLEEAEVMLAIPFKETYLRQLGAENGSFDEEADTYLFHGDQLDLTIMVQDQVLLNLPGRLLCSSDCKGLCPVCGANRNLTQCSCRVLTEEEAKLPRTQQPFKDALAALASDDEEV